ncbi:MAG: hypothetical protein ABIU63_13825 [Chitinophagaceae bacterium]
MIIRNKKISLSSFQVLVFFGCKIIAGAVYGYLFKQYYHGDDTWALHQDGLLQYQRLLHTPAAFFADFLNESPVLGNNFNFQPASYLENLEYAIITKTLAFFNLVSRGNYYLNVVFFNFLTFWGVYFLYKLLATQFDPAHRRLAAAVLFLFPPSMFWLSGIRAEGLLLLYTAVLLYQFYKWLGNKKIISLITCIICFTMAMVLRNGFALALVPPLMAWAVVVFFKMRPAKVFAGTFVICLVAVCGSGLLQPRYNILSVIAARQHDFLLLKGNTRFHLTALEPQPLSFVRVLPEALVNTFVRPFIWEARGLLQWFAAVETLAILVLVTVTVLMYRKYKKVNADTTLVWVLVMACLYNYIIVGYIVPFPGAIVRYKIIPELLLIGACIIAVPPGLYLRSAQSITASRQI